MTVKYRRPSDSYDAFMIQLDEFYGDPELTYAAETLGGIYDWCDQHGIVTDKQVEAVTNIVGAERMEE